MTLKINRETILKLDNTEGRAIKGGIPNTNVRECKVDTMVDASAWFYRGGCASMWADGGCQTLGA